MTKTTKAADRPAAPKRRRIDWEAVERDYRTGQFTLKELETKHGAGFSDISKRAKREGWTKDLREVVRQATSAAVIAETTKTITKTSQTATTNVVLAAAEVAKDVILRHRAELSTARDLANTMLAEVALHTVRPEILESLVEQATDGEDPKERTRLLDKLREAMSIHSRGATLQRLADTLLKLHQGERKAFQLEDEKPPAPPSVPSEPITPENSEASYRYMVGA